MVNVIEKIQQTHVRGISARYNGAAPINIAPEGLILYPSISFHKEFSPEATVPVVGTTHMPLLAAARLAWSFFSSAILSDLCSYVKLCIVLKTQRFFLSLN